MAFLARRLALEPDEPFDVGARLAELLAAMARFESGKECEFGLFLPYSFIAMQ